jgi:hypothetical protein
MSVAARWSSSRRPSIDLRDDPAYLERFILEEWIARRINSAQVLKPCPQTRKRHYLYVVTEYVEGQTLAQWMLDNPAPERGNGARHRRTDRQRPACLPSYGNAASGSAAEQHHDRRCRHRKNHRLWRRPRLRTHRIREWQTCSRTFSGRSSTPRPEYFLGEPGLPCSDLFSLGVITYQMLCGRLPYGAEVAKARTRAAQRKLHYQSVLDEQREIPAWIDAALAKAVHPDPNRRYAELSEFTHDLRHPNPALLKERPPPLIERNPLRFWQGLSFVLAVIVLVLLSSNTLVK